MAIQTSQHYLVFKGAATAGAMGVKTVTVTIIPVVVAFLKLPPGARPVAVDIKGAGHAGEI